ncbi:nucleoside-diphosphate sugar epimerase/dehydratase [Pararhodobacter sp. SW119]|uniref:polysaccharide biosynthesis protein n=1 Tax=Pararhodobacter sp. SW119 TaxID=2780075 RepID=UPI001ADF3E2B|nr:nucleoside-diphosphate sugar epimerase/dehydratase [Pararhodobacter sp. SW119]
MLGFVKWLSRPQKQAIILALDVVLVPMSMLSTAVLQYGSGLSPTWLLDNWLAIALMMASCAALSVALGLPRIQMKSYEMSAMGRSAILAAVLTVLLSLLNGRPGTILLTTGPVIFGLNFLFLSAACRLVLLHVLMRVYRGGQPMTRVLIYGAGTTGMQLALALRTHATIRPQAFVDDNAVLHGLTVAGLRVHPPQKLAALIADLEIDRVILAMPSLNSPRQAQIARRIADLEVEVQSVPSFSQLIGEEEIVAQLAPVLPTTLLGRTHLGDQLGSGCEGYRGRSVLITGAGGSIGSELCRQVLNCRPARLVLMELSEFALYSIESELRALAGKLDCTIVPVLGTITDRRQVRHVLELHQIEVVLHAAAYKHVPMVEANPLAGVTNNVLGTNTLAREALDFGVERFILVSSDKAVRPVGVMGATKRLAELIVADLARESPRTVFATVRFGNVLGSSGSVIPRFREQILRGGPVTLTHPEITRYFMTAQEATRLVLWAGTIAKGGEIFVLDMGRPVRIADLARQVIETSGYSVRDRSNPEGDIEIAVIGLRPGEKLHEELSITGELQPTRHDKVFASVEAGLSGFELARALHALRKAVATGDGDQAVADALYWSRRDLAVREADINQPVAERGRGAT